MNYKELATLKNAYDRRKELLEFEKHLKENPLQEQEYISLIEQANLNPKDRILFQNHIKTLRKNNMLIDDNHDEINEIIKYLDNDLNNYYSKLDKKIKALQGNINALTTAHNMLFEEHRELKEKHNKLGLDVSIKNKNNSK